SSGSSWWRVTAFRLYPVSWIGDINAKAAAAADTLELITIKSLRKPSGDSVKRGSLGWLRYLMMKPSQVLITGGAGFIGSHLADELLKAGYGVRILDNLSPQVHGSEPRRPDYLADEVDLMVGDVRDHDTVRRAL